MIQILSLCGAALVLTAFAGTSMGRLDPRGVPAQALNLVGSLILCGVALAGRQLGFILLNGVWSIVSAWTLVAKLRARP